TGGAKEFSRERQQIRSPRAGGDHHRVSADTMSILQCDAVHATAGFIQRRKFGMLAKLNSSRSCVFDECSYDASAFGIPCNRIKEPVPESIGSERRETFVKREGIEPLDRMPAFLKDPEAFVFK